MDSRTAAARRHIVDTGLVARLFRLSVGEREFSISQKCVAPFVGDRNVRVAFCNEISRQRCSSAIRLDVSQRRPPIFCTCE